MPLLFITDSYNTSSLSDEEFIGDYVSNFVAVSYILLYESGYEYDIDILFMKTLVLSQLKEISIVITMISIIVR